MQDFRDKIAVITGGASGIGLACCELLVARGATLVLADIDEVRKGCKYVWGHPHTSAGAPWRFCCGRSSSGR